MFLASQAQQEKQRIEENARRDQERREDRADNRAFMLMLASALSGKPMPIAKDHTDPKDKQDEDRS